MLFEGITSTSNTQDCRIIHRLKSGVIYPPKPQGLVMAHASCNLLCGIDLIYVFRCYVKTKCAEIYDIQSKI